MNMRNGASYFNDAGISRRPQFGSIAFQLDVHIRGMKVDEL